MTTQAPSVSETTSVSFRVDDVAQHAGPRYPLPIKPLRDALVYGMGRKKADKASCQLLGTVPACGLYETLGYSTNPAVWRPESHALLSAVHTAYENHLALTFSPDMIWQTILQGVSQHINRHPDAYRHLLVKHDGIKDLLITRTDLTLDDLPSIGAATDSIVDDFMRLLKTDVARPYYESLQSTFSTTGRIEAVSAAISCMEAFAPYFSYTMMCGCGFPKITLRGTAADWRAIRSKVNQIEELFWVSDEINLTWWTRKLAPVIDGFVSAAEGAPDVNWWKRMYKQVDGYLVHMFNGWIGWLFPYVTARDVWNGSAWGPPPNPLERNPMLNSTLDLKAVVSEYDWMAGKAKENANRTTHSLESDTIPSIGMSCSIINNRFMQTSDFPLGLSKATLHINDVNGKTLDTVLVGGFVGVSQDAEGGLIPEIGYGLVV